MNYKHSVLQFNIIFILLLLCSSLLFQWKSNLVGKENRPLEIISSVKKTNRIPKIKKDSLVYKGDTSNQFAQRDFATYKGIVTCNGKTFALSRFYKRLHELLLKRRKKIRIAYFGDSMIEGDLLTQDLRSMFQNNFGGNGVGFMPITSIVAGFRQTISHSFSTDWKDISFKSENKQANKLFLSGHSFLSSGNSVVTYRAVNYPKLDIFNNVSLLYGQPIGQFHTTTKILVNGKQYGLKTNRSLNLIEIDHMNCKELKLQATATNIPFYGVAFESDSGVIVDNYSFRGISGLEFNYFDPKLLEETQNVRPYDLIIFHYGTNLLFKPQLNEFNWYEKSMTPILQKLKNSFPESSILMISTADKGASYNGDWKTAIGVEPLVQTQYNIACNVGIGFFNLYNAMGGEGTIVKWVNSDTTLANKDYTHPNGRGAKILASLIYKAIINEFSEYKSKTLKEN